MTDGNSLRLGDAVAYFLAGLSSDKKEVSQPEINKFVQWYGRERPLASLAAPEIANYAERLSLSDAGYSKKLEIIRTFLTYARKEGWSKANLAIHLKTKKTKASAPASTSQGVRETISLTRQGHAEIEAELAELKIRRLEVIEEVRRAAADKDFRENAPLHAAREQKGHIDGRIRDLEETLKSAVIIGEEKGNSLKAGIGDSVVLYDEASAKEMSYMIVHPKEVDPSKGKISSESPIGKAIVGKSEGTLVEIAVPAGKLRYRIKQVKH